MLRSSCLVMNQGILGLEQKFGDTIGNSVDLFVYCDYSVSCQLLCPPPLLIVTAQLHNFCYFQTCLEQNPD